MNHRELIASARRNYRFAFSALPHDLQDRVVDGLDSNELTLREASALIESESGVRLSHEAVSGYYAAVRRERRVADINDTMRDMIQDFAQRPTEEGLQAVVNLALAAAAHGIADGSVGIKNIDLAKLAEAARHQAGCNADEPEAGAPASDEEKQAAAAEAVRKIYGL